MNTIGNKIHELRTGQRLSLRHLTIKMDNSVTPEAIRSWENGRTVPKNDKLRALAQALGADITNFLPERDNPVNAKDFIKQMVADGISQSDIAMRCGLSQGTIHKIVCTNSVMTFGTAQKIAAAYNKPLSFFFPDLSDLPPQPGLSDADVDRIADAVVAKLQASKMS